jgi:hypothetical protein
MTRADLNSVKLAVQQAILDTPTFTVSDIAKRTGFRLDSIHTQVQRMKKQGIIEIDSAAKDDHPAVNRRGAPSVIYRLTQDLGKLQLLRDSVLAFYLHSPKELTLRPTSKHFTLAHQATEKALRCDVSETEEIENLLEEAELQLELVTDTECDADAPENLKAHIAFQQALVQYARRRYADAATQFSDLRTIFLRCDDYEAFRYADNYYFASRIRCIIADSAHYLPNPAALIESVLNGIADFKEEVHNALRSTIVELLKTLRSSVEKHSSIEQHSPVGAPTFCIYSGQQEQHLYHYLSNAECQGVIGHLDTSEKLLQRGRSLPLSLKLETYQGPLLTVQASSWEFPEQTSSRNRYGQQHG